MEFKSYISDQGLHGTITFLKVKDEIQITTNLRPTLEFPEQTWSWHITEFPVDYSDVENRCDSSKLGNKLVNLDDILGYLFIPDNGTTEYTTTDLKINGHLGIYGKSIVFKNVENEREICASIVMVDKTEEKTAVASFSTPVAGNIYFRWFSTKDNHTEMLVTTDLYHVHNKENFTKSSTFTEHKWKIYVTDILESDNERHKDNCNILQIVFDPDDKGEGKGYGDIDVRLGKVKISTDYNKHKFKTLYRDEHLMLLPSDLTGPQRRLYVVLFENKHEDVFLGCSKIRYEQPINAR